MKCDCCKKRKKLFESFAEIRDKNNSIHLCVKCNDLFFKLRDASSDGNEVAYEKILQKISKAEKDTSKEYEDWKESFIKSLK